MGPRKAGSSQPGRGVFFVWAHCFSVPVGQGPSGSVGTRQAAIVGVQACLDGFVV